MSVFEILIYEKDGPIARVILNRRRVLNAHNVQMYDDPFDAVPAMAASLEWRRARSQGK